MKRAFRLFRKGISCAPSVLTALLLGSATYASAEEPRQIGRVIISGNDLTPDWAINRHSRIRTGDKFREADVRAAEERLRASKLFRTGPGQGPRIEAVPNELDDKFLDLRIYVDEHPWSGVSWGLANMWTAARVRDLNEVLRAAIFLKYGVRRLSDWREEQR